MSRKKVNKSEVIRKYFTAGLSVKEIKEKTGYKDSLVRLVIRNYKNKAKPSRILAAITEIKNDIVNKPLHYTTGGVETLDFIEAKDLNYRLGNVVKYVVRAGKKHTDPVEDLKKARFYLDREITVRERA
jgi:hypothetical protein